MQYSSAIRMGLQFAVGFMFAGQALAEGDYPAAYFEPYIVFQAPEVKAEASSSNEAEASTPTAVETESEASDPYPAAYFEPKVVYQDEGLLLAVANPPAVKSGAAPAKKSRKAKTEEPASTKIADKDRGGVPGPLAVLLLAGGAGLYWFTFKKSDTAGSSDSPAAETASAPESVPDAPELTEPEPVAEDASAEATENAPEAT